MAATLLTDGQAIGDRRRAILRAILARLGPMLQSLASDDPALVATWNRLDTLLGRLITIQAGEERFSAVAEGIDASGGLQIRREGRTQILIAGRILRD